MDEFLEKVNAHPLKGFELWLDALSAVPTDGFRAECWSWVNAWGSGGGSYETEMRATEMRAKSAIEECSDESPKSIADAVYHAIADCTESPMSASCITQLMIEESEAELGQK